MLTSFALIFLVGLSLAAIFQKIRLPRIIGMLLTGILLGPYVLDLLDPSILGISADLRKMALVIILIKAGLSLNIKDLIRVGRPAILMAFLPASFEIVAFVIFAPMILGINQMEAAIMGSVLAAVSPAIVVPRMVRLIEEKYGTDKRIPQMILAGASLDDVFVIVLFTTFVGIGQGGSLNITEFLDIPVSVVLGILLGLLTGYGISWFFEKSYSKSHMIRNSLKVIIIIGISFTLLAIEDWLKGVIAVSGLLAILSMALIVGTVSVPEVVARLQEKFGKLWIAAEIVLFVLVGAVVDIRYTFDAGLASLAMIMIGLSFRSVGVFFSTIGTELNCKERFFCIMAYLPKATVQAAIGSIPLSLGLNCGNIVLSTAVMGILVTAPLGAICIDNSYKKLLKKL